VARLLPNQQGTRFWQLAVMITAGSSRSCSPGSGAHAHAMPYLKLWVLALVGASCRFITASSQDALLLYG